MEEIQIEPENVCESDSNSQTAPAQPLEGLLIEKTIVLDKVESQTTEQKEKIVPTKLEKVSNSKSGVLKMKNKYKSSTLLPTVSSLKSSEFRGAKKKNQTLRRGNSNKKTLRSTRFKGSRSFEIDKESDNNDLKNNQAMRKTSEKKYPFKGKWQSNEVELDTFMSELNLSNKFAKLAVAYGGDVTNELKIRQSGEKGTHFVITENNERRKIKYVVNVGEQFTSFNELEEELECISSWGVDETELIIEELNKETGEITKVTRKIENDILLETRKIGAKQPTIRKYRKYIKQKKRK